MFYDSLIAPIPNNIYNIIIIVQVELEFSDQTTIAKKSQL